ncbi:unnamed protein product, partial [Linum tenue]
MSEHGSEASNAHVNLPPPPQPKRPPDYDTFRKRKVEDFYGDRSTDPMEIDLWLSKVTRTLQEMRADDEDKVLL